MSDPVAGLRKWIEEDGSDNYAGVPIDEHNCMVTRFPDQSHVLGFVGIWVWNEMSKTYVK